MKSPKLLRIFLCTFLMPILTYAMPQFQSSITLLSPDTQAIMKKYTWKPDCPVPLSDLVQVKLSYWGFDDKAHQGVLIVNKALAINVVTIFRALYYHKFPIERMQPIEDFKGDDNASMAANNTSAFNCRAITNRPGVFSQHSYGRAIDINPLINPYVKGNEVLPGAGEKYVDRSQIFPGKITKNTFIYTEFTQYGWSWGGDWHDLQDYQHFEKRGSNDRKR